MKTIKPHRMFFITGIVVEIISLLVHFMAKTANIDITVFNINIQSTYSGIWMWLGIYILFLSGVYLLITNYSFKTKTWLVRSHYVFVILFLLFFAAFSVLDTNGFRTFITNYEMPLMTVVAIYSVLLLVDIVLFIFSWLLLLVNLFSLRKEKQK